jgi:hypothetical protein
MPELDAPYVYEPTVRRAVRHVRSYPRHYAALALWAAAMVLVPTVAAGSDGAALPIASSGGSTVAVGNAATATGATSDVPPPPPAVVRRAASAATALLGSSPSPSPSSTAGAGAQASPEPVPAPDGSGGAEPTPAVPGGVPIPPPPSLPLPPPPAELAPLVAAVAPLASQGCSAIGLAGVVAAVAGPTAGDAVPIAALLPYLAPAYQACAAFPVPQGERTICEIDEQARAAGYPTDASGLMKTPNLIGTGIDTIAGIEVAIEAMTGQSLGIASVLYGAMGCHPDV